MDTERRPSKRAPTRLLESGPVLEIETLLSAVPYFAGASSAVLRRLSASKTVKRLSSHEILQNAANEPDRIWFVQSGVLIRSIVLSTRGSLAIDLSGPGEGVDEASVFGKTRPGFQIKALVDSTAVGVPLEICRKEIVGHPDYLERYAQHLAAKLVESEQLRLLATESATQRVVRSLIILMSKLGRKLPVTDKVLVNMTGVSSTTAIRALSALEMKSWIRCGDGTIELLQPDQLLIFLDRKSPRVVRRGIGLRR